jgi:hypothetical protein
MKIQGKHLLIAASAIILLFTVKMCKAEAIGRESRVYVDETHRDSLMNQVVSEIETKDSLMSKQVDSLRDVLEKRPMVRVIRTDRPVKEVQTQVVERLERVESIRDINVPVIKKDTIIYNIIVVDSIVPVIIYKIDTICYDSKDVKKLKLRRHLKKD